MEADNLLLRRVWSSFRSDYSACLRVGMLKIKISHNLVNSIFPVDTTNVDSHIIYRPTCVSIHLLNARGVSAGVLSPRRGIWRVAALVQILKSKHLVHLNYPLNLVREGSRIVDYASSIWRRCSRGQRGGGIPNVLFFMFCFCKNNKRHHHLRFSCRLSSTCLRECVVYWYLPAAYHIPIFVASAVCGGSSSFS